MGNIRIGRRKDKGIKFIKDKTDEMFLQAEKMMELSKVLLEENSNEVALLIIEEENYLDQLHQELIDDVNKLIIKEQPTATDLRIVLSVYVISSKIEGIGDYYKQFAKMMLKSDIEERKHQKLVLSLLNKIETKIKDTREAFNSQSHELSIRIARRNEEIDDLIKKLIIDVNNMLVETSDLSEVKALTRILSLAKIFERSSANLTVICEQISYIEKGQVFHYS